MTDADPSNAELGRRIDSMANSQRAGFETINLRLDKYVLAEVHTLVVGQLNERQHELATLVHSRFESLEKRTQWRVTTVVAVLAFLVGVAGVVVALVK